MSQHGKFCRCIKHVKKTMKRKSESGAIAICTKSMLWPKGRTIKKITCGKKGKLVTQKRK